jgi:CDP-paratose 2-epimerase
MERAVSIAEMLDAIADETGTRATVRYEDVRPGDQPLYVSDTRKLTDHTGWRARRSIDETLRALHRFWLGNRRLVQEQRGHVALMEQAIEQEVGA